MSSFFLGSEAELENRFSELLPGRKLVIFYFCVMVIFLFVILNTEQFAPKMLLVVVAAVCLIACILWMYPICNHRQGEALAVAGNDQRWHSEQRVHVPPFATRAQLSDVRIQLALLDRDFDYRDFDALRALDDDITPAASTMGEEDANALPVHGNNSHHIGNEIVPELVFSKWKFTTWMIFWWIIKTNERDSGVIGIEILASCKTASKERAPYTSTVKVEGCP